MTRRSDTPRRQADRADEASAERQISDLRHRLEEANDTIDALLSGEIDSVADTSGDGDSGQLLLRRAQAELRASEQRLRTILEHLPVAVWVADADGGLDLDNPAARQIWGELRHVDAVPDRAGRWADSGEPVADDEWPLLRALRHGETVREAAILLEPENDEAERRVTVHSAAPIRDEDGEILGAVNVAQDVTESRQLQERLQQKQKMEAVGQLAGGIAHEFNNLLTAVLGHAELLSQTLEADHPGQQDVATIRQSGKRAADLTRQLLAYGRKQIFEPRILDPNDVIRRLEPMLAKTLGEGIEIRVELEPEAAEVQADPGQLEQVILALALNARDAMPEGGRLTLRTRNLPDDQTRGRRRDGTGTGFVALEVADEGTGMTEATQQRIFEPFFSTKETGEGTGLGLSTVQGVIEQTGGHVRVDSGPGRGSTFTLLLPRLAGAGDATAAADETPPSGGETVLVAEDEELVRQLVSRTLESAGYRVLLAAGADDALETASEHDGPLHLLVSDVVMPGMKGPEMAERMRRTHGDLRVLFISGYGADAALDFELPPDSGYLSKPVTPSQLRAEVRRILDRDRTDAE